MRRRFLLALHQRELLVGSDGGDVEEDLVLGLVLLDLATAHERAVQVSRQICLGRDYT